MSGTTVEFTDDLKNWFSGMFDQVFGEYSEKMITSFQDAASGEGGGRIGMGALTLGAGLVGGKATLAKILANKEEIKGLTKALGGATIDMGVATYKVMEKFAEYGDDFYGGIQETFGGIQDLNNMAEEMNATSRGQVEALESITGIFYDNTSEFGSQIDSLTVMTNTRTEASVNALSAYFEKADEVVGNYSSVFNSLRYTQTLRMNDMNAKSKAMLGTFSKGFAVSNAKISEVLDRNIALTGKASTDIFNEISNFSKAVADQTGIDFKNISQMVIEITTDVEKFGNVHPEAASRIAGALGEIGLSYSGFSSMVGKFQGFDQAAGSLGNLTTLFGVHFDAMEMMMLANEDQEEFLHRMREAFLETGRSIDDMTLAEKRLASQELGMGVKDFENFMRADRDISDLTAATAEASQKTMEDGFETMTQQMRLIRRDSTKAQEFMRQKFFHPLRRDAKETSDRFAIMFDKLLKVTPEKFDQLRAQIQGQMGALFQTDEGSAKIFESKFFGALDDTALKGEGASALMKKIRKDFEDTNKILTAEEILAKIKDFSDPDRSAIVMAMTAAQRQTQAEVAVLINENRANEKDLFAAFTERTEDLAFLKSETGAYNPTQKEEKFAFDIKTDEDRLQLIEKYQDLLKKSESENPGIYAKLTEEFTQMITALQTAKAGDDKPVEIVFQTTGPEARLMDKILRELKSSRAASYRVTGGG